MKKRYLFVLLLLCGTLASAQDCKPDDFSDFENLKAAVQRVIKTGIMTGWDMKALNRSGDMAALAIVKEVSDDELVKAEAIKRVLLVLHESFPCLTRCVEACGNREPRLTLLLLDHLRDHSRGDLRKDIEVTRQYVLKESQQVQALSR